MLAVIKTGGKQYKVKVGDKIKIEKLDVEPGKAVKFEEVLAIGDDAAIKIGAPVIEGASVEGKVLRKEQGKKVVGIKHKPKKRYKVKFGHRQMFSEVEITKI
jgi:large subunit ribosomal protein L21